uniref:Uncharacterized protein n=1 Tax=viral metagenome TaxID=1070528 RepID=A0A6M3XGN0_9ZZZZ
MGKIIDLTGQKFGRLTVLCIGQKGTKTTPLKWKCICECGNVKNVSGQSLKNSAIRSCGCLQKEVASKLNCSHHGWGTRLYSIWDKMIQRCTNRKHKHYKNYGGRGIKVHKQWKQFKYFKEWAYKNGYTDNLTIDRIDNNGNYEPGNCRFITLKEQQHNKRTNRVIELNGKSQTMKQWADELQINYNVINSRINTLKWDEIKALTTPTKKRSI